MGCLYGWKKEYLLEQMTFGQIAMYVTEGLRFKYPKPKPGPSLVGAPAEDIRARRDELRERYGPK